MPQAKLPDINAAWVRYRNYGLQCIDQRNYSGACAAINEINALFPDEYRVEINTEKHNELMREAIVVVCSNCGTETNYSNIKIFDLLLPLLSSIIAGREYERVWSCPNCKHTNKLQDTKMIKDQHANPFYHKVIPKPPERRSGLEGRRYYHNNMVKWFFESLEEMDHQLGRYRDEYKPVEETGDVIEGGNEDAD